MSEPTIEDYKVVLEDAKVLIIKLVFSGEHITTEEIGDMLMKMDKLGISDEL